jgi:hypothetical protein
MISHNINLEFIVEDWSTFPKQRIEDEEVLFGPQTLDISPVFPANYGLNPFPLGRDTLSLNVLAEIDSGWTWRRKVVCT